MLLRTVPGKAPGCPGAGKPAQWSTLRLTDILYQPPCMGPAEYGPPSWHIICASCHCHSSLCSILPLLLHQEERDRRAQIREQALEKKIQQLMEQTQMQKHTEPTNATLPTEPTHPTVDHEEQIEFKMNKVRVEDKAKLQNEFWIVRAQAVNAIGKSVASTIQAALEYMANELNQCISILEKDKEQARKKPKYPIRDAKLNDTLRSQNDE
ncbi:hypothetical protein HPB50_007881 [Hyalomma asiaticum]|uniref:Uncharacterized protein n=1 Tax=Hyalomma asiaticum TaxID=266040 RepID=A0ACB7TG67_HYAAI|nr:hypothetical protein HPB50_007881 [Hyalomma asiaticum]